MRMAYGVVVCLIMVTDATFVDANAAISARNPISKAGGEAAPIPSPLEWTNAVSLNDKKGTSSANRSAARVVEERVENSISYHEGVTGSLREAVMEKLGAPYRWGGIDNRGYDCSGFVWRVFQDAGVDIQRGAARDLWQRLPEAAGSEENLFGTIVFFHGLNHVGIVRDRYSFYHASTSQGVVLSYFTDSAGRAMTWGDQVVGYRRIRVVGAFTSPR